MNVCFALSGSHLGRLDWISRSEAVVRVPGLAVLRPCRQHGGVRQWPLLLLVGVLCGPWGGLGHLHVPCWYVTCVVALEEKHSFTFGATSFQQKCIWLLYYHTSNIGSLERKINYICGSGTVKLPNLSKLGFQYSKTSSWSESWPTLQLLLSNISWVMSYFLRLGVFVWSQLMKVSIFSHLAIFSSTTTRQMLPTEENTSSPLRECLKQLVLDFFAIFRKIIIIPRKSRLV